MQAHGNGIGEIRLPDDDGDQTATHCVAERDKAGGRAPVEWPKASRAAMSERIASSAKRDTASASTLTMLSSHATAWATTSAASTAGRLCDNLTS